jgi:hypothetical protein
MGAMRRHVVLVSVLALALAACGSDAANHPEKPQSVLVAGGQVKAGASNSSATGRNSASKTATALGLAYQAPAVRLTTDTGKVPAVVVLPSTDDVSRARREASKLVAMGVGVVIVPSPAAAPEDPRAFDSAVARTLAAVDRLARRADIDPQRIGLIGEGVGAHIGAVAMGRKPSAINAAVLADIGGVVVPSNKYAPERWLSRAIGPQLLFQRDKGKRSMTQAEVKRLLLASPPGTLLEQYGELGSAAEVARDRWIKEHLIAG